MTSQTQKLAGLVDELERHRQKDDGAEHAAFYKRLLALGGITAGARFSHLADKHAAGTLLSKAETCELEMLLSDNPPDGHFVGGCGFATDTERALGDRIGHSMAEVWSAVRALRLAPAIVDGRYTWDTPAIAAIVGPYLDTCCYLPMSAAREKHDEHDRNRKAFLDRWHTAHPGLTEWL